MNYLPLGLTVILLILSMVYEASLRKTIKKLIIIGTYWRNESIRINAELRALQDQYRQVARILDAMKDINKLKK